MEQIELASTIDLMLSIMFFRGKKTTLILFFGEPEGGRKQRCFSKYYYWRLAEVTGGRSAAEIDAPKAGHPLGPDRLLLSWILFPLMLCLRWACIRPDHKLHMHTFTIARTTHLEQQPNKSVVAMRCSCRENTRPSRWSREKTEAGGWEWADQQWTSQLYHIVNNHSCRLATNNLLSTKSSIWIIWPTAQPVNC